MKRKLTIKNFLNEMTYDLNMSEMEKAVEKYQFVLINYVKDYRFKFSKRSEFEEVMSYVADDRFLEATERVAMTSGLECDFSHVLIVATIEKDVVQDKKQLAIDIGFRLRTTEFANQIKNDELLKIVSYISLWTFRGVKTSPFYKIKEVNGITEMLPTILYNSPRIGKMDISKEFLRWLYETAIPGLKPEELLAGILRTPCSDDEKLQRYEIRLKSFVYQLIYYMDTQKAKETIMQVMHDIRNFGKTMGLQISLDDVYLDNKCVEKLVKSNLIKNNSDKCRGALKYYNILEEIKKEGKYNDMF